MYTSVCVCVCVCGSTCAAKIIVQNKWNRLRKLKSSTKQFLFHTMLIFL